LISVSNILVRCYSSLCVSDCRSGWWSSLVHNIWARLWSSCYFQCNSGQLQ